MISGWEAQRKWLGKKKRTLQGVVQVNLNAKLM
jgi:hypothetical protein